VSGADRVLPLLAGWEKTTPKRGSSHMKRIAIILASLATLVLSGGANFKM